MTAYVPKGELRVGDRVALALHTINDRKHFSVVLQVSTVERIEPSQYHTTEEMDEVTF